MYVFSLRKLAKHYVYNRETLSYEAVSIPLGVRLRQLLIYTVVGVALSTVAVFAFSHFFETPRTVLMHQQNYELQLRYELLMQRFRQTDATLTELLQRDNKVYRSIFEADMLSNPQTKVVAEASLLMDKITKKAYIQSKSFDEISSFAHQKELMMDCIPSIQPLNIADPRIRISALFGYRTDPIYRSEAMHNGIDFAGPMGTSIYAAGNGRVINASYNFHGYGYMVMVDHGFGYKTRYAHLSEVKVKRGDVVNRGQIVALMGNTGKSTGPHLHYEVLYKDHPRNPIYFFNNDVGAEEFNKIIEALSGEVEGATDY